MVSITCGQPQKEYMVELAIVVVMFVLVRFQGITLLNEHNFPISLTCGVPFCVLYNLIMCGIIHLVER